MSPSKLVLLVSLLALCGGSQLARAGRVLQQTPEEQALLDQQKADLAALVATDGAKIEAQVADEKAQLDQLASDGAVEEAALLAKQQEDLLNNAKAAGAANAEIAQLADLAKEAKRKARKAAKDAASGDSSASSSSDDSSASTASATTSDEAATKEAAPKEAAPADAITVSASADTTTTDTTTESDKSRRGKRSRKATPAPVEEAEPAPAAPAEEDLPAPVEEDPAKDSSSSGADIGPRHYKASIGNTGPIWGMDVGTGPAGGKANAYATYHYYAPGYETSSLYCADVFNTFLPINPDHWLLEYPWTAFCNDVPGGLGPMTQDKCGRCLKVTNTATGQWVKTRVVDMCGQGGVDMDPLGFNAIDGDYNGVRNGHMDVALEWCD